MFCGKSATEKSWNQSESEVHTIADHLERLTYGKLGKKSEKIKYHRQFSVFFVTDHVDTGTAKSGF